MPLLGYVLRRSVLAVPVLLGASLVIFLVVNLTPNSPVEIMLGPYATPQQVDQLRNELWLDRPLPLRYLRWLGNVVQGDLGRSFHTQRTVAEDLARAFPATLELSLASLLIVALGGIVTGVLAAANKNRWFDHLNRIFSLIGVATPIFWLALLLQLLFYQHWGLLPVGGRASARLLVESPLDQITGLYVVDALLTGNWQVLGNALVHLVLPATVLASRSLALLSRLMRASLLEVLGEDYIRTARASGIPDRLVLFKYALRNSLLPFITVLGMQFGQLLGGTFLIETVFDWPGMGLYGLKAIQAGDFPALLGVVMLITLAYLLAGLIVDLLYAILDPRIKY